MKRSRNPICLKPLLLMIALLSCAQTSLATTVIIPSDDQMIVEARAIVRGRVLAIEAGLDEQQDRIYTYVTLKVQEVLKGRITQRKIVLKQPGGEYGSRGSMVFGTPEFTVGENVILYLDTWRDGSLRVHQMLLGKFAVIKDPDTGVLFAVRNAPDASVQVLGQSSKGPITNRMELSAYTGMVRSRLAANRRAAREFEARAYDGVPVLERPAEYIIGSQKGDPEVQFHIWNPPLRWFEADTGQSVVFKVNTDSAPPQVENDVIAATNAWSSVAGCSLRVVEGGTTDTCGLFVFDGTNTISFNNCDGYFSGSGDCSSGILAVTSISSYDRNQTRVVNGVTFYKALEANLTFNPFSACSFSDHCQLQEIITHEMGHALGLHHSWDPTFGGTPSASDQIATMYWVAHFDGRCASLKQDDMNGITFIYPAQGGGPGPLTIVSTSPLGTGTVGSAFSRQLIASGGTTPYTWSLLSGSLPDGVVLNPTGLIGGTPTATGTSDFTVKVTDAQSATAQKALQITITAPSTGYDAQFVSQNVPATLQPSQLFVVTIRWLNTGSTLWNGGGGFSVISQNPAHNIDWGGDLVPWFGLPVAPGEQMELVFQAFAPGRSGVYNFQWQLFQQDVGFFGQMSANVSITVGDPTQAPPLSIGGPSALSAVKGILFTNTLTATGGTPPYSWSVATGALPSGIGLNPTTGALSGAPAAAGSFSATVQVTDSRSQTAQKVLMFMVTLPPVEVVTSTLPAAVKGVSFNQQLNAAGGKAPYTWSVTAGALPGGLSLAAPTGVISGTPNATGSFSFTVTATDADSHTASKPLSITVAPPPLSVAAIPAIETLMGLSFNYQLSATGGTSPYTWAAAPGAIPPGLNLNATGGLISGTPTTGGLFTFSVTVRDSASVSATATVQIKVIDPATIPAIRKVKLKGGRKLIVMGDRINPAAVLLVDGNQMPYAADDGQLLVKPIALASGSHEIRIVNPGNVSSAPYILKVE
jgi:hypothetical protein